MMSKFYEKMTKTVPHGRSHVPSNICIFGEKSDRREATNNSPSVHSLRTTATAMLTYWTIFRNHSIVNVNTNSSNNMKIDSNNIKNYTSTAKVIIITVLINNIFQTYQIFRANSDHLSNDWYPITFVEKTFQLQFIFFRARQNLFFDKNVHVN